MRKTLTALSCAAALLFPLFSAGTAHAAAAGIVTGGNSKTNCIDIPYGAYGDWSQANLTAAEKATGTAFDCVTTFNNPQATWAAWASPWEYNGADYASFPGTVLLGEDLIPQSAETPSPQTWEQQGADGAYNGHATALARNLVAKGACKHGPLVIRLGIEANGNWEADYVGTTRAEGRLWAATFDNEVKSMRAVAGSCFLFTWNPNVPYSSGVAPLSWWYPGSAYVDIVGADVYDVGADGKSPAGRLGWLKFYTTGNPSLYSVARWAAFVKKPIAIPEWGLEGTDDAVYVNGIASMVKHDDAAYQSYFDSGRDDITPLGPRIPKATAAYQADFG